MLLGFCEYLLERSQLNTGATLRHRISYSDDSFFQPNRILRSAPQFQEYRFESESPIHQESDGLRGYFRTRVSENYTELASVLCQ